MPQRIVSELQVLVAETRRKYPEVRVSAEKVLQQLQSDTDGTIAALRQSHDVSDHLLVQPIVQACETRSPKVIQIALSLLHRSIMLRAVPDASLVLFVDTLHTLLTAPGRADVDIQLKILQTVSALLLNYERVTSKLLSRALMLCFSLYEHSRVAVVSSTAAATLRQNIMTVFDKVHKEDRIFDAIENEEAAAQAPLPAYSAQLPDGPVTLFPSSSDAYLVLNDLCALADGEPASFLPLSTLSKPFVLELLESVLINHASLFLQARHRELVYVLRSAVCPLLLKALTEPPPFSEYVRVVRLVRLLLREFSEEVVLEIEMLLRALLKTMDDKHMYWQNILAWETVRALFCDISFLQRLWHWFDGRQDVPEPPRVFASLLASLTDGTHKARQMLMVDAALAAAFEQRPSAANSTRKTSSSFYDVAVAGVRSAAEGLLSPRLESLSTHSVPSISLLDQLDKTDAPPLASAAIPSTYMPWLVLQSLVHLAHGLATLASTQVPLLVACTRTINDSLSFFLTVSGADKYFEQALQALTNLTQAAGCAACNKERDLLLGTLCDLAVPSAAYSGQALGARNLAAQAALVQLCMALAERLGVRWRAVLQCVCQALACLVPNETALNPAQVPERPTSLPVPDGTLRFLAPSVLEHLPERLRSVVEHVASLDEATRTDFAQVLSRLLRDRVCDAPESSALPSVILAQFERFMRACAPTVAAGLPDGVWSALMELLSLMEDDHVAGGRRIVCARVLDGSLQQVLHAIPQDKETGARQRRVLEALAHQGTMKRRVLPTDVSVRRLALDTLRSLLETQAHALLDGWDTVFATCEAAAKDASVIHEAGTSPVPILRTAFACVQLVCGSHLSSLSDDDLRTCMATLSGFSLQQEDVSMALRANGSLWDLTEDIERRQQAHQADLWLGLLQHWRNVAQGPQPDVAAGALGNLFQVLVQFNASLQRHDWYSVLDEVLMPLLEAEMPSPLAFEGTARILVMAKDLRNEKTWTDMWMRWLGRIQQVFASGPDNVAHAAIQALCNVLQARAEPAALWRRTWTCIQDLSGLRADASLTDLCIIVQLLQTWHAQRDNSWHANDSHLITKALTECILRGVQRDIRSSTADLRRLTSLVQQTLEQLLAAEKTYELVLQCAQQCCAIVLDAMDKEPSPVSRVHTVYTELADLWLHQWQATYRIEPGNPSLYSSAVPAMLVLLRRPLSTFPVPHVPNVWRTAMDVLTNISEVSADVQLAPSMLPKFWEAMFTTMVTALEAPAQQRPTEDEDVCTWHLLQSLEHVLGRVGVQESLQASLTMFVRKLLPVTSLYSSRGSPHRPLRPSNRERTAYWVWSMLFRACSREDCAWASSILFILLSQCEVLLHAYAQDVSIRGAIPMPRVRIEEVNFLLQTLLTLRLPACGSETVRAVPDPTLMHLFQLGPLIDDIATIPSSTCASPQKACVGTSLPPLPCEGKAGLPVASTTPQALARKALQLRTSSVRT